MEKLQYEGVIVEDDQLKKVEAQLRAAFVPVSPRTGFVQELHYRLVQENRLEIENHNPPLIQSIFITAAGLLSGVVLIALGIRGLVVLVNSLGSLQQVKNGIAQKKPASAQPLC